MTEILSIPTQPNGPFFNSNPLRRTSSQSSLFLHNTTSYPTSSSGLKQKLTPSGFENRFSTSLTSSARSSPRINPFEHSTQPSYSSTPSSILSLDDQCSTEDDEEEEEEQEEEQDILFPDYDDDKNLHQGSCLHIDLELDSDSDSGSGSIPALPPLRHDICPLSVKSRSSARLSRPKAIYETSSTEDDTAVRREPTAHVDYLSHIWAEEDIWASWRYIISKRKVFENSMRLENAVWRSWTKSKYQYTTIAPGQLNWEKDHDVTWLYGPLQTGSNCLACASARQTSQLSRGNSFASKKPILKKRSLSEVILQRSLASSTLIKQATDALWAQQPVKNVGGRPILQGRTLSDFGTRSQPKRANGKPITTPPATLRSTLTSGAQTPCTKRHIHFNNKVEQCIAINKGGDERYDYFGAVYDDSSSEDEPLTMKTVYRSKSGLATPRNSFSGESKTIAMLPSTTLKYRGDTPDPVEQEAKQRGSSRYASPKISPCPSQRTITPWIPSVNFLAGDGDDEDDDDDDDGGENADPGWQPLMKRNNSLYLHQRQVTSKNDDEDDVDERSTTSLRRTPSGMFMPYEEEEHEEEESLVSSGLIAKVVDTVNTARDIAHVIWNVGWRR